MDIVIIDDHSLFSSGLVELLGGMNSSLLVSSYTSYEQAKSALCAHPPRLILLDLDLGLECGLELSKLIVNAYPKSRVAILSANEDVSVMKACALNGVVGYITKSASPDVFVRAVQLILEDGSYFPSHLLPYLLQTSSQEENASREHLTDPYDKDLTPRQKQVFGCLKQGKSNKVIAYEMGISEGTVKLHVSAILNKLGASNRSEAISKIGA